MASNVNVWQTNWRATGRTVPVPQYEVDLHIEWTGHDGEQHERILTPTFPNDLQLVPAAWLKEELTDLLLRAARKRLGVD